MYKNWIVLVIFSLQFIASVKGFSVDKEPINTKEKLRILVTSNRNAIKQILERNNYYGSPSPSKVAHRKKLLQTIVSGNPQKSDYTGFMHYLAQGSLIQKKMNPITHQIIKGISDIERRNFLLRKTKDEKRYQYIKEALTIDCIALLLHAEEEGLRTSSKTYFKKRVNSHYLNSSHLELLISAWNRWPDIRSIDLLSLIAGTEDPNSTAFVQNLMRQGEKIPDKIRAKMGDKEIEKRMISNFLKEEDPEKKGEIALELGYIGSPDCIYALASEMRTPLIVETPRYAYSVRYKILQGLQWAFPEEELFNEVLLWVKARSIANYNIARVEKHYGVYYDLVEKWCAQQYQIKWKRERPPFLLYQERFVIRPGDIWDK